MKQEIISFTIEELVEYTGRVRSRFAPQIDPDPHNEKIPHSVFQYQPITFKEDNIYHVVLGALPDECIWTIGITAEDAWIEFDKELNYRLQPDGTIKTFSQSENEKLHADAFARVDLLNQLNPN